VAALFPELQPTYHRADAETPGAPAACGPVAVTARPPGIETQPVRDHGRPVLGLAFLVPLYVGAYNLSIGAMMELSLSVIAGGRWAPTAPT
jgi:hypothetical protein